MDRPKPSPPVQSLRPFVNLRITIEPVAAGDAVALGQVTMLGLSGGQAVTIQIPICAPPQAPDGWPGDRVGFGEAIRLARTARQMSQAQLAKSSGVTEQTVRYVEKGQTAVSPQVRELLLAALGEVMPTIEKSAENPE